jgi:cytoskeleton protein RodZ
VSEAGGKQVLRRTVKAGETVGVSGALPLTVVVGRASGIDVQVRGKPFDLKSVTKPGGVARFEVKP